MTEDRGDLFFDTVTLSNFALAGRLDLLLQRYGPRARVTPEVLDEVLEGIVVGYDALKDIEAAVESGSLGSTATLSAEERGIYRELLRVFSPGEASCIACAKARGGIVVTDDRTARERSRDHGVAFTGTIGILKAPCLEGALAPDEADAVLKAMVDTGYFSPVRRISDLL
jgi:predicted nucleic acid-binding protein